MIQASANLWNIFEKSQFQQLSFEHFTPSYCFECSKNAKRVHRLSIPKLKTKKSFKLAFQRDSSMEQKIYSMHVFFLLQTWGQFTCQTFVWMQLPEYTRKSLQKAINYSCLEEITHKSLGIIFFDLKFVSTSWVASNFGPQGSYDQWPLSCRYVGNFLF